MGARVDAILVRAKSAERSWIGFAGSSIFQRGLATFLQCSNRTVALMGGGSPHTGRSMRGRIRWQLLAFFFLGCVLLLVYSAGIGMWSVQCEPRGPCQFTLKIMLKGLDPSNLVRGFSSGLLLFGPIAVPIALVMTAVPVLADSLGLRLPARLTGPIAVLLSVAIGFYWGVTGAFENHGPPNF